MKDVLVTGAAGFIGSHLVRALAAHGTSVRAMYRGRPLSDEIAKVATSIQADLQDEQSLIAPCSGMSTVFHVAAVVGHSRAERAQMNEVNIEGTRRILAAAIAAGVETFVYVSSCVTIGALEKPGTPLTEQSPFELGGYNLGYIESKRAGEQLVVEASRAGKIRGVIVNPSVVYGAGDALKESRKAQVKVALGEMLFYPVGGVSVASVENVVSGILGAWQKGRAGERYLLAGQNMTIQELFSMIAECAGVRAPPIRMPTSVMRILGKVGDASHRLGIPFPLDSDGAITASLYYWYSSEKASQEFGYQATNARDGVESSVRSMLRR